MNAKQLLALLGGLIAISCGASAEPVDESFARCKALGTADFSGIVDAPSQVTASKYVEATDGLPAHCQVKGYVAPSVGFGLRLPALWNGKFMQIGCGGHCGTALEGSFAAGCDTPVRRGYACLVSDMGHTGTGGDGVWAYNNLQAKVDWALRATHVATVAGKAVAAHYYARPSAKSYFMGCSTGGRQALQAAQRFPWDFDGIVAGAPPIDLSVLYMSGAWGFQASHDRNGNPLLDQEDLKLMSAAAVAKCDLDDGVKDGIIGDPLRCSFEPAGLACKAGQDSACLTPAQLTAAKKIYAGPANAQGVKLTLGGPLPGSEQGSWGWYIGPRGQETPIQSLFANGFRYLFFWPEPGASWTLDAFDFDRDYKRMGSMQALAESGNPDLRKFKAAGGKLLMYQGMNDGALVRPTVDYYETVEHTMGGRKPTQDFMRLFMLPGVNHCAGGEGADAADFLGHLEAWVERDQAPDRILSGHLKDEASSANYPYKQFPEDPAKLAFTRPVYPYPTKVKYLGRGDINDAANFGTVKP